MRKVVVALVIMVAAVYTMPSFADCGTCGSEGKGRVFQDMSDGISKIGDKVKAAKAQSLRNRKCEKKMRGTCMQAKNCAKK